jgi:ABC-type glycerol-3-phosphate transport system substrate-binding protein
LGFFIEILFCDLKIVYLLYMKKVTFILALGVALTLSACGSESTATQTTDSTSVQADTTSTSLPETGNAAEIPADSAVVK